MRISEIFQLGYDRDWRDRRHRHRHYRRFPDYRRRRSDDDDGLLILISLG